MKISRNLRLDHWRSPLRKFVHSISKDYLYDIIKDNLNKYLNLYKVYNDPKYMYFAMNYLLQYKYDDYYGRDYDMKYRRRDLLVNLLNGTDFKKIVLEKHYKLVFGRNHKYSNRETTIFFINYLLYNPINQSIEKNDIFVDDKYHFYKILNVDFYKQVTVFKDHNELWDDLDLICIVKSYYKNRYHFIGDIFNRYIL